MRLIQSGFGTVNVVVVHEKQSPSVVVVHFHPGSIPLQYHLVLLPLEGSAGLCYTFSCFWRRGLMILVRATITYYILCTTYPKHILGSISPPALSAKQYLAQVYYISSSAAAVQFLIRINRAGMAKLPVSSARVISPGVRSYLAFPGPGPMPRFILSTIVDVCPRPRIGPDPLSIAAGLVYASAIWAAVGTVSKTRPLGLFRTLERGHRISPWNPAGTPSDL